MTKEELKEWRIKHNLTQMELAELLSVTRETIARWETGMRKIPPFLRLALVGLEKLKGREIGHGLRKKEKGKVSA